MNRRMKINTNRNINILIIILLIKLIVIVIVLIENYEVQVVTNIPIYLLIRLSFLASKVLDNLPL